MRLLALVLYESFDVRLSSILGVATALSLLFRRDDVLAGLFLDTRVDLSIVTLLVGTSPIVRIFVEGDEVASDLTLFDLSKLNEAQLAGLGFLRGSFDLQLVIRALNLSKADSISRRS